MPTVGREGIEPPQPKAADLQSAELTTLLNLPAIGALHASLPAAPVRSNQASIYQVPAPGPARHQNDKVTALPY